MDKTETVPEAPPRLMSPNASLTLALVPPLEIDDPRVGKRIAEPGVTVKFNNGFYQPTAEEWALIQESPYFTGKGQMKRVYVADEEMTPSVSQIGLTHGALTAATGRKLPRPTEDWDEAGAVALAERISNGAVSDLEGAFAYEMANKRRKTVVRAITEAMLGDEKVADPAAPIVAPVPDGQGGL